MTIKYDINEKDYVDFNLYHVNTSKEMKKRIFLLRVIGPITFMFMSFVAYDITDIPLWYWLCIFCVAGLLWFLLYPKLVNKRLKAHVSKMLSEGKNDDLIGEHTLELNEEEMISTSEQSMSKVKWSVFNRVERTEEYIYIYNTAVSAYIVPLRAFKDEKEINEFWMFITSRVNKEEK